MSQVGEKDTNRHQAKGNRSIGCKWAQKAQAAVNGMNKCKQAQRVRMDTNRHEGQEPDTPIGTNSILWAAFTLQQGGYLLLENCDKKK